MNEYTHIISIETNKTFNIPGFWSAVSEYDIQKCVWQRFWDILGILNISMSYQMPKILFGINGSILNIWLKCFIHTLIFQNLLYIRILILYKTTDILCIEIGNKINECTYIIDIETNEMFNITGFWSTVSEYDIQTFMLQLFWDIFGMN